MPALLLGGCGTDSRFRIQNLAKADIDVVADVHIKEATALLESLTRKLYKMNPAELKKTPGASVDAQVRRIFQCPPGAESSELDRKESIDAILLGFEPDYPGDRIFAMMYGLYTMIFKSYSGRCELYMVDFLDEQSLYNSARNIEIFVWRIKNRILPDGRLVLETNQIDGPVKNLSFERLFGKLISLQDTMALIVSSQSGRLITKVVHTAATTAFIPIGL
ncbi:hypothetical protein [Desulfospira joergensenii]|uniref:hypothetical protein n=1 Tax=Desulfospira joergensenii TaxID=53329 RepID=UPI0003B68D0E|nr:hypothetical protein [Desulfospira joergensenii]